MKKKKEKESIPIELKLILLGDSSVGKSSIFGRLSGKPFSEETIATVGLEKIVIDFDDVKIDENVSQNFKITLFDTAGQERYRSITRDYFRNSQGIILLYSIADEDSFKHIENWLKSIKDSLSDWKKSEYMIMLLANKLDIAEEHPERRMILIDEAERICSGEGIYWGGECSAKTSEQNELKEIFEEFIKQIYLKIKDSDNFQNKEPKQVQRLLTAAPKPKKKKKKICSK